MSRSDWVYTVSGIAFLGTQGYLCYKEPVVWLAGMALFFLMGFVCKLEKEQKAEMSGRSVKS